MTFVSLQEMHLLIRCSSAFNTDVFSLLFPSPQPQGARGPDSSAGNGSGSASKQGTAARAFQRVMVEEVGRPAAFSW